MRSASPPALLQRHGMNANFQRDHAMAYACQVALPAVDEEHPGEGPAGSTFGNPMVAKWATGVALVHCRTRAYSGAPPQQPLGRPSTSAVPNTHSERVRSHTLTRQAHTGNITNGPARTDGPRAVGRSADNTARYEQRPPQGQRHLAWRNGQEKVARPLLPRAWLRSRARSPIATDTISCPWPSPDTPSGRLRNRHRTTGPRGPALDSRAPGTGLAGKLPPRRNLPADKAKAGPLTVDEMQVQEADTGGLRFHAYPPGCHSSGWVPSCPWTGARRRPAVRRPRRCALPRTDLVTGGS